MYSRRLVFGAACLGMLLFGIVLISLGSVLPSLTSRFALDDIAAGSLAALLPFGILIGSLVFGPVADRYGYKSLLVACVFLVFLSLEGIAFARTLMALQISILLIGFGGGILNGATNALVADISAEGRGAGLSLLGVFFGIGALGTPAILGLLSSRFTQEGIIAGIGAVVLVCAGPFAAVQFPAPKHAQGFPLAEGMQLLRDARLMLLAAVLFFQGGMEGSVNNWTTTFLQQEVGATTEKALFALSSFVAGLAIARLLLSRLLKRFPAWKVLAVSVAFSAAGCLMLWIAGGYASALSGLVLRASVLRAFSRSSSASSATSTQAFPGPLSASSSSSH